MSWLDHFTDQNARWDWVYYSGTGYRICPTSIDGLTDTICEIGITAASSSAEYSDCSLHEPSNSHSTTEHVSFRVRMNTLGKGTAGWGIWDAEDGTTDAAWFWYASAESDAVIAGFRMMVTANGVPVYNTVLADVDPTAWHTYEVIRQGYQVVFKVDGVIKGQYTNANTPSVAFRVETWYDNAYYVGGVRYYLDLDVDEKIYIDWIDFNEYRTVATTATTNTNNQALNMPAGIEVGDLLIALSSMDNTGGASLTLGGWTELFNTTYTGNIVLHAGWAKIAEGGDSGTLSGTNQDSASVVIRLTDHGVVNPASDIKVATTASNSSNAPNPPSLDAGSSAQWLWLESFGADDDDDTATYWSTNYTGVAQIQSASSTSSCLTAVGARINQAQTEDPGNMAMAAVEEWVANTLAIPPPVTTNPYVPEYTLQKRRIQEALQVLADAGSLGDSFYTIHDLASLLTVPENLPVGYTAADFATFTAVKTALTNLATTYAATYTKFVGYSDLGKPDSLVALKKKFHYLGVEN